MAYKASRIPDLRPILASVQRMANVELDKVLRQQARDERQRFVTRIKYQDFASFRRIPLSAKWLARKRAAGADLRTMIATQTMIRNIRVFRRVTKNGFRYRIGFHPAKLARKLDGTKSDRTLDWVARVNEFGSEHGQVPARPHWRPFARTMAERARPLRRELSRLIAAKGQRIARSKEWVR